MKKDILDYFPEEGNGFGGFSKEDKVVLARVFMDKAETQMAASILRINKIPHFIADSNATLFTENILGGERLFVKEEEMDIVAELLGEINDRPIDNSKEEYQPFQMILYYILGGIVFITLAVIVAYRNMY